MEPIKTPIIENAKESTVKDPAAYAALIEIDNKERNFQNTAKYFKAYSISILIPPLGIYYFIKYFFFGSGSEAEIKAAFTSLVLTIISLLLSIWLSVAMFKSVPLPPGVNTDMMNEYITPANQQKMRDLFQ